MQAISLLGAAVALTTVLSSSMIYYAERTENPEMFPSIPGSFWWALVTMTTVGYGDKYPITTGGQLVAACTMIFGILLIALPMAIVGNKFQEVYSENLAKQANAIDNSSIEHLGPITTEYFRSQESKSRKTKRPVNLPRSPDRRASETLQSAPFSDDDARLEHISNEELQKSLRDLCGLGVEISDAMGKTFAAATALSPISSTLLTVLPNHDTSIEGIDGTGGTASHQVG